MNIEQLREMQLAQYRQVLDIADTRIWSQPWFPQAHRPEVGLLKENLTFSTAQPDQFIIHPGMKPELKAILEQGFLDVAEDEDRNKIAMCYPDSHVIQLRDGIVTSDRSEVRRVLFHEAATDRYSQPRIIVPDEYDADTASRVDGLLRGAFDVSSGIGIGNSTIERRGFRRVLMVDGYFVTDMVTGQNVVTADEIYPTIIELLTEELFGEDTDIDTFEREISSGEYKMRSPNDHIFFTNTLLRVLRVINWRDLLDGLAIGDAHATIDHLDQKILASGIRANGAGVFMALINAMSKDEERIKLMNDFVYSFFGR